MCIHFPTTVKICLEDNYRSTGAILETSIAIVSEGVCNSDPLKSRFTKWFSDTKRPPKTLRTSHDRGIEPILRECRNEHDEADFIAIEIKRVVAATGGMLLWKDFAILRTTHSYFTGGTAHPPHIVRYNALSRALEAALQHEGIPNRVLSGVKFFERLEIKDLLAYLQLIDNPDYEPAFLRVINVPKRQIGEKVPPNVFADHRKPRTHQTSEHKRNY
jgi:DNA helicase-2/ATP-dependent DNA helicase PcrA